MTAARPAVARAAARPDWDRVCAVFPAGSGFGQANPVLSSERLRSAAQRLGHALAQIALAWLLGLAPNVLLIPGTSFLARLEQRVAAAGIKLDERTLAGLTAAT